MATIFVNVNGTASDKNQNGTSWNNAYTNLQTAIAAAQTGDKIWVAKGNYRPTLGIDRTISFVLKDGVQMYGGFAGNETNINQRNVEKNVTELSGDIGTQDNNSDNSHHVVDISNTTRSSVLDGFTISNGSADDYSGLNRYGGGIYGKNSNAVLSNLILEKNSAIVGGGLYSSNSELELSNILFSGNSGNTGGAVYNNKSSSSFDDVIFQNNSASSDGGALYNATSNPSLILATLIFVSPIILLP